MVLRPEAKTTRKLLPESSVVGNCHLFSLVASSVSDQPVRLMAEAVVL